MWGDKRVEFEYKGRELIKLENKIGKSRYGEAKGFEFEFYRIKMNKNGKKGEGRQFFSDLIRIIKIIIKMNCNGKCGIFFSLNFEDQSNQCELEFRDGMRVYRTNEAGSNS